MGYDPKLALLRQVINRYSSRTALFDYMSRCEKFSKEDLIFLRDINHLVTVEFSGIVRDSGEPYINHLNGVCAIGLVYCEVYDPERLAAAQLHDIIETFDDWTEERVAKYSTPRTAHLVKGVSIDRNLYYYDDEDERRAMYYEKIAKSSDLAELKAWDRGYNQLTLSSCSPEKQRRKNKETEIFVLPIARRYNILVEELEATVRETDERLALITTP